MYLPAEAQDRLFEQITELSAPGSRVSAEAVRHHDEERRAEMRQRWEKMADDLGIERKVDIGDLTYNDPHRANSSSGSTRHGWTRHRHLVRRRDAPSGSVDRGAVASDYQDGFSTFVIAERR